MLLVGQNNSCAVPYSNALSVRIREYSYSSTNSDRHDSIMYFVDAEYMSSNKGYSMARYETRQQAEEDIIDYVSAVNKGLKTYHFGTIPKGVN